MNKLILFLFLLSASAIYSQDYNPLVNEGSIWVMTYFDDYGVDNYCAFKIEGDTIVNNVTYNKVYKSVVEPMAGQSEFRFLSRSLFGLIREIDKQVYFIRYEDYAINIENCPINEESLIYDFDIELRDTLALCNTLYDESDPLVIFAIEENITEFNLLTNTYRYGDVNTNYLIEGIGYSNGLFVDGTNFFSTGYYLTTLIYYCRTGVDCPFLVSSKNLVDIENTISIFPNPTSETLQVALPDSGSYNYRITTTEGRTVLSGITNRISQLDVDISNVESGMYFITLQNGEQSYVAKFVVIN